MNIDSFWEAVGASALAVTLILAVLSLLAFLFRTWISERISYGFDRNLERFKDDIGRSTAQHVAVQSAANASLTEAQRVAAEWRVRAADELWRHVVRIGKEAYLALTLLDLLRPDQYDTIANSEDISGVVPPLSGSSLLKGDVIDHVRPVVGERLYSLCFFYRVIFGRIWFLLERDIGEGHVSPWFNDTEILQHLAEVLTKDEMNQFYSWSGLHLWRTRHLLESKILNDIRRIIAGTHTVDEGLTQAKSILEGARQLERDSQ